MNAKSPYIAKDGDDPAQKTSPPQNDKDMASPIHLQESPIHLQDCVSKLSSASIKSGILRNSSYNSLNIPGEHHGTTRVDSRGQPITSREDTGGAALHAIAWPDQVRTSKTHLDSERNSLTSNQPEASPRQIAEVVHVESYKEFNRDTWEPKACCVIQ